MNYFKFHIGDYIKNTAHLSLLEHGIYFRLLMIYYTRNSPLPSCNSDVYRLMGNLHWRDRTSIDRVLSEFFVLLDDGWHNLRADKEIALDQLFIAQQRAAGRSSAAARREQKDPVDNSTVVQPPFNAGSTLVQPPTPTPTPTPIHTPLPPLEKGGLSQRRSPRRLELDKARVAWSTLIASGGKNRDSRIQAAIDAAGGWLRIAARTGRDEKDIRASFCEAYVNAAQRNGASQ
jgi:uncharacterized protein YdaU (DUF1376 family)